MNHVVHTFNQEHLIEAESYSCEPVVDVMAGQGKGRRFTAALQGLSLAFDIVSLGENMDAKMQVNEEDEIRPQSVF